MRCRYEDQCALWITCCVTWVEARGGGEQKKKKEKNTKKTPPLSHLPERRTRWGCKRRHSSSPFSSLETKEGESNLPPRVHEDDYNYIKWGELAKWRKKKRGLYCTWCCSHGYKSTVRKYYIIGFLVHHPQLHTRASKTHRGAKQTIWSWRQWKEILKKERESLKQWKVWSREVREREGEEGEEQ